MAVPEDYENTLKSLRLVRRFNAILMERNENLLGMLRKSKDYITWGELGVREIAMLLKERGELQGGTPVTDKYVKEVFGKQTVDGLVEALTVGEIPLTSLWQRGIRPVFRLRPPSGGFMYNIKRPFGSHGELGYRGVNMTHLVARMV